MSIESFDEIKTYFETNKDSEEVKGYVGGLITPDRVNSFLDGEDGKKLLQPKLDSYHGKGLETWKTKNLNTLVDAEIKKRFPDADPKDVELKNMKAMIEQMKADGTREKLTNSALKTAQEKKLPAELVDFMVGKDADTTNANLEKLAKIFQDHDESIKLQLAKDNSYIPPGNSSSGNLSGKDLLRAQVRKSMGIKEKTK